jgi:hypothetical protein
MDKHQAKIRLRFRGIFRISVRFSFEWKAWLLAYDLYNCSPQEFSEYDIDKQFTALCFGAASWDLMKRGRSVYFTFDDMTKALNAASKADNRKLADTMKYAQFPDWLRGGIKDDDKKKETSP